MYIASLLVSAALGAQLYVRPFQSDLNNRLEIVSLVATLITQMGSILYGRYVSWSTGVTIVLLAANGFAVLFFIYALVRWPPHSCDSCVALRANILFHDGVTLYACFTPRSSTHYTV